MGIGYLPQRPLNAVGSFLAVANTLVLTTHIGFVNIAVTAPFTLLVFQLQKDQIVTPSLCEESRTRTMAMTMTMTHWLRQLLRDVVRLMSCNLDLLPAFAF